MSLNVNDLRISWIYKQNKQPKISNHFTWEKETMPGEIDITDYGLTWNGGDIHVVTLYYHTFTKHLRPNGWGPMFFMKI